MASTYRKLGLRLTYHPARNLVQAAACPQPGNIGKWSVSEGRSHPKTNACLPVNSQLGVGHERGRGPVDPVDDDRHEDRRLSGNLQFRGSGGSLAPTGPAVAEYQRAGSSRGSV